MKLVVSMSWQLGLVCVLGLLLSNVCLADWRAHEIEQLNGTAPRIKATAQIQIITLPWDMGPVYYPYMVYMPEQDKLLMLLMYEGETKAGIVKMAPATSPSPTRTPGADPRFGGPAGPPAEPFRSCFEAGSSSSRSWGPVSPSARGLLCSCSSHPKPSSTLGFWQRRMSA